MKGIASSHQHISVARRRKYYLQRFICFVVHYHLSAGKIGERAAEGTLKEGAKHRLESYRELVCGQYF
jgi:hypothetical protein